MPPKGKTKPKNVLPPFYAFGKLDKHGKISDKKGAKELAKATVTAGGVLGRLIPALFARRQYDQDLQQGWQKGALDIQRTWRGHRRRGLFRPWLNIYIVVECALHDDTGHTRHARDLQRVWRGHVQRKRVAWGDTPKWHAAASKLQRLYRGSVTRQLASHLKWVRCVPAAFMLVAMAVKGDNGVLRRLGGGKCREPPPKPPRKPDAPRPASRRPETNIATGAAVSAATIPAGQVVADHAHVTRDTMNSTPTIDQHVARAMDLSQQFLTLTQEQLDLVFNFLDPAREGHIRRKAVVEAVKRAQLGDLGVEMFFALADTNGDGLVDRQEYDSALKFCELFFSGRLRDEDTVTDVIREHRIKYLEAQLAEYNGETDVIIQTLSNMKLVKRAAAIFEMPKHERLRVARVNRNVIQEADVFMQSKEQRLLRQEITAMTEEPDKAREFREAIDKLKEDIIYEKYFILRSPCRPPQLSRAELAVIEAEKLAAEEAARQERLQHAAVLHISVLRSRDLIAADRGIMGIRSTSDPYIRLYAGGKSRQTKVVMKTLNPEWNEHFELLLEPEHRRGELQLECFDFDALSADDSLGQVAIPLEHLVHEQRYRQWHTLCSTNSSVSKGEVELQFQLLILSDEEAEDARRAAALAEVPAILEITVVRGIDLLAADRGNTSDPFVHMRVGKSKNTIRKTSVRKKVLYQRNISHFLFGCT
jgi:hypothetical protein